MRLGRLSRSSLFAALCLLLALGGPPFLRRCADHTQGRSRRDAGLGDQAAARPRARRVDRGHHRVPPRQRPARPALPRPDQATRHRQHHRPGRLAPRGLRRDRHGPPARAHALQGHAQAPQHPEGAAATTGRAVNGTTCVDRTNYFETLPATDENLELALELEADRMVNSHHRQEGSGRGDDRRPQRVRERARTAPARVLEPADDGHRLSNGTTTARSTIGNRSDIERVPIDNLQAFYKTFYQPDNAVLIVAGKFDEAEGRSSWFTSISAPSRSPTGASATTYTEEPAQDGERMVDAAARGRLSARRWSDITCRRRPIRTSPPSRWRSTFWAIRPPAGCTRRWWRPRRQSVLGQHPRSESSGYLLRSPRCCARGLLRRCARRAGKGRGGPIASEALQGGDRSAPASAS